VPASFVGRAAEVTGLAGLWAGADAPAGPTVALVFGRPGEGKTRLLAEVCTRVAAADQIALHGYEPESGVSLASARDLLAALSSGAEGSLLHRLLTGSASQTETLQLFEAAFQAVRCRGSLRLVVDDLQWVDPTSAALLHYLVRAAEGAGLPLTVLAAGRPTVASTRLAAALSSAVSDPARVLRLELGPLDRDAGTRLARELAADLDERAAAQLWQQADGSPFWIEELARSRGNDPTSGELGFRLRGLSGDAAAVLAVLAAAGRQLERASLAELGGWPAAAVDRAVDDLGALGLVTEAGSAVAVAHDLIRDSIADCLPRETLRQGHERLARWLAGQADDAALLEAVGHGRRAGVPVVRPALLLAESPRRRLLGPDGLRLLRSVAAEADVGTPEGAALDRATAQLATELGEHEMALTAWSGIARRARDASLGAEATLAAAQSALHLGRTAEAERLLQLAAGASSAGTGVEVDAQAAVVQLWLRRRRSEGEVAALRAVRAARRLADRTGGASHLSGPDRQAFLHALLAGAEAAIFADRPADVLALTDELAAAATAEDGPVRLRALAEGSLALRWMGRNADAEARLRVAWAEARAEALPQATVEVGALLARVLYSRGRLAEAAQVVTEGEELGRRLAEYCPSRAFTLIIRHLLQASGGDWSGAADGLRLAVEGEDIAHYRLHAHLERALLLARYDPRRTAAEVHAATRAALADATESGCRRCTLEVRARSAEALARVGDPGGARRLLGAFDPDPVSGSRALHWYGIQARAALLTAEGGAHGSAVTAWDEAVAEADRCGFVLEALWARIDLAAVLLGADRARATAVLRDAGAAADAIGARTEAQAVDRALRGLGVRTWSRAGGTGLELTAREREIAARVAAGASNAEIAAAMFLSRKTVERHVSNVLAKSGQRNRAELAAWATTADVARRPEGVHR
jgi:DNA-binding CsgD family transcriptional regulator